MEEIAWLLFQLYKSKSHGCKNQCFNAMDVEFEFIFNNIVPIKRFINHLQDLNKRIFRII